MHELSLVINLFDLLEEKARQEGISRITAVKLRCGHLAGVVPECFATAFEIYKKNTCAAEAKLVMEMVPVKFQCRACGHQATKEELPLFCPACGSTNVSILEGTDLTLVSFEAEI